MAVSRHYSHTTGYADSITMSAYTEDGALFDNVVVQNGPDWTSPEDRDAWPVVVRGDNGDWSQFPVGAVEFLGGVYRRTIHVGGMPGDFPSHDPQVLGLSDRID
jgi:hypothetical protein